MPTTTDVVPDIMRPVFDTLRIGQEVWLGTIRTWAEFGQRFWPTFFSVPAGDQSASPAEMVDMSFECARKLLDVQEECARAMFESAEPILGWQRAEVTKPQRATKVGGERSSA